MPRPRGLHSSLAGWRLTTAMAGLRKRQTELFNPSPYPGIVVGAVHGRRGTRAENCLASLTVNK